MINYLYDGSFPGLLSVFYHLLREKKKNSEDKPFQIFCTGEYQQNLFSNTVFIKSDDQKSEQVYKYIKENLSSRSLKRIYYAFLSGLKGIEAEIYQYLLIGLRKGKGTDSYYNNDIVFRIYQASRKVSRERHRLIGLLRFKKIKGNLYYAALEPDYNILVLIAPHFAVRMSDQSWLIHDLTREIAAVYQNGEWLLTELKGDISLENSEEEEAYQELWKTFFKSIALDSRKNLKLQKQFMPARYWKHLIEKN